MSLGSHRPDRGSIWLTELERFCGEIRSNGGTDHTQVFVRSADGFVFNVESWRRGHSKGPVLEIGAVDPEPAADGPTVEELTAHIKWLVAAIDGHCAVDHGTPTCINIPHAILDVAGYPKEEASDG